MASIIQNAPAFEFSEGLLLIDSPLTRLRIGFQPKPRAEEFVSRGRWAPTWPEFRLLACDSVPQTGGDAAGGKQAAFDAFRATVPADVVRLCSPFQSHQWLLMCLVFESPRGRDLAESNPVLAYAVANSYELRGTLARTALMQAIVQCSRKQKNICAWLGFPDTQAMVRLFRRLRPDAVTPSHLRRLRHTLGNPGNSAMDLLGHRKSIGSAMLAFVGTPDLAGLLTPSLLDEIEDVERKAGEDSVADQLFHALQLQDLMQAPRRTRPFQTVKQVCAFVDQVNREYVEHRRIAEEQARRRAEAEAAARAAAERRARQQRRRGATAVRPSWPPPPIPGNGDIVPITSFQMLKEEADAQQNCVDTYAAYVANRDTYIYRVLRPERATLAIAKHKGGDWQIQEIKAERNAAVAMETRFAVTRWLYGRTLSAHGMP